MADILCGYTADRDETLIAYLYGDIDASQRSAFEAHIATCERCRSELAELRGVRGQLEAWTVPEAARSGGAVVADIDVAMQETDAPGRLGVSRRRAMPAWAQVAAAVLVLGVSAGLANLDIRYDQNGLTIRTGWSRVTTMTTMPTLPASAANGAVAERASVASDTTSGRTPWRSDFDALEKRLKTELHATPLAAPAASQTRTAAVDGDTLQQVRALLRDSERKQQNELALRIAEVVREFDGKRGTDLVSINQTLRTMQNSTGIEVLKQREALSRLDYLVRASGQR